MKYSERTEYLYDPEIFKRSDTRTALSIHDEYIRKLAGKPYTKFFEVDRSSEKVDLLWGQPTDATTQFSRFFELPSIVQFDKMNWNLMRLGRIAQQKVRFWVSNLALKEFDYFPLAGDLVYWSGYRAEITAIDFEPNSFWQQTNVWLGLICVANLVPDGDAKPATIPAQASKEETLNVGPLDSVTKVLVKGKLPENPTPPSK